MSPSHPSSKPVVVARGLYQTFGEGRTQVTVLSDIEIEVAEKEFAIVMGPSGCGKTTLLNSLAGLEPPTKGKVWIRGEELYAKSEYERATFRATRIGMVYQQSYWIAGLTVVENVAVTLAAGGTSKREAEKRALEVLGRLRLDRFAHSFPTQLSGGEQQRVGVARAIVHDPWLVVADEPTGSLDTHNADEVMNLFARLNAEEGRTILLVTHNPIYLPFANRFIGMRDGKVVQNTSGRENMFNAAP